MLPEQRGVEGRSLVAELREQSDAQGEGRGGDHADGRVAPIRRVASRR
jgi:hypothetical protein